MTLPRSHRALVVLALATVYVVWGSTYLAIRIGVQEMPPFLMAGVRFLAAGIPFYFWARSRTPERPTLRMWGNAALVGGLMLVGGNGLVTVAEKTVASSIAALIITTVPLWMVVLDAAFVQHRRIDLRVGLGLLLGFGGVAVLLRPTGAEISTVPVLGGALLLIASFSWAVGSLLSRRAALPRSTSLATAMEMVTAGAAMIGIGFVRGEAAAVDLGGISTSAWAALGYLTVFGSIFALSAYGWLLKHCSAAVVGTYAFVNPIVAVILGAWLADEPVGPTTALAGGLILAAVGLIQWSSRRPRPVEDAPAVRVAPAAGAEG